MLLHINGKFTMGKLKSSLLLLYKADFIHGLLMKNEKKLARSFNFTFRYIVDVLSLNNSKFSDFVGRYSVTVNQVMVAIVKHLK
jgi:hypothetical protein